MDKLLIALAFVAVLGQTACGNFERENPCDPSSLLDSAVCDTSTLLIGTWTRDDAEKNQVYTFKMDQRVELRDYSAPGGGTIDRNASYPQTLVLSFTGTYVLVGDLLRINFTDVQTNELGGEVPTLRDKQVNIRIVGNTLTLKEIDGDRIYTRF